MEEKIVQRTNFEDIDIIKTAIFLMSHIKKYLNVQIM